MKRVKDFQLLSRDADAEQETDIPAEKTIGDNKVRFDVACTLLQRWKFQRERGRLCVQLGFDASPQSGVEIFCILAMHYRGGQLFEDVLAPIMWILHTLK